MKVLFIPLVLSYLAIQFALKGMPIVSVALSLALFFYMTNALQVLKAIFKHIFAKKPKRVTKLDESFQVTNVEMEKGLDYLRQEHPTKNDAEILQLREKEMIKLLNEATKKFDNSKYDKHFKLTMFYNFEQKLIMRFEPKTPFANSFLIRIMNIKMEKGAYYESEEE